MDKRSLIFIAALSLSLFGVQYFFNQKTPEKSAQAETISQQAPQKKEVLSQPATEEQFYVLENEYQQLVFSNFGGAISEINLPFLSKENPHSVVRSIESDTLLEKQSPKNELFPLTKYQTASGAKEPKVGGYYPLLRRKIVGDKKKEVRHYALNIASEDAPEALDQYIVKRLEKNLIEFEYTGKEGRINKIFSLPKDPQATPYIFDMEIQIEGNKKDLILTSGVPEVELISGSASPTLKYRVTQNQKAYVKDLDLPKHETLVRDVTPDWICNSNGFFGLIIDPLSKIESGFSTRMVPGASAPTRLSLIDQKYDLYPTEKYPGYEMYLPVAQESVHLRLFAGPFDTEILKTVDKTYLQEGNNPQYLLTQTFHGWFSFISEPFARFLFLLMKFFYFLTHSWGFSIILLTAALRLMLYPLNAWSIKSTSRMQTIAPHVAQIQEKHKKDPKRAQQEVIALYREKGVNPLSGCFPMLIQMPFLIGMFDLLKSSFELRGVSFIPGWINNLTAPDVVFSWAYPIPFFGTDFHLLPFLLGATMFLQQKFSSTLPKDPALLNDSQKQQKMMGNVMAIVFTVLFYHFPSGLNLYWLFSMLFGIVQQWWMTRKKDPVIRVVK